MPVDAQVLVDVDVEVESENSEADVYAWDALSSADENEEAEDDEDVQMNLIYTPTGIFEVPERFIMRDHQEVLPVSARMWRKAFAEHRALSAASFLANAKLRATNIVCIADPDARSDLPSIVLWFIRLSVDGGNDVFKDTFGQSFLWQIPHGVSIKVGMALSSYEKTNLIQEEHGSELLRRLACSRVDFRPEDWPCFPKVQHLYNYYDTIFAMACAPCAKPLRSWEEAQVPHRTSLARPVGLQPTGKCAYFDAPTAPDDAMTLIMQAAAKRCVHGARDEDVNALLDLRLVCKSWNQTVEHVAVTHFKNVLTLVKHGARSGKTADVFAAREVALGSGLPIISLIQDSAGPLRLLNYLRVRNRKHPGSLPPVAPAPVPQRSWSQEASPREEDDETELQDLRCILTANFRAAMMDHAPVNVADAL